MPKIKLKIECQECGGTGVYQGFAERDGAGVICNCCRGSGCEHYEFEYKKFKGRKKSDKIKRVFISGYGYCVGIKPVTLDNGIFVDFSKEGVSYKEFLAGKMPEHIKHFGCPMIADQGACHGIKGFTDICNNLNGGFLQLISECKHKNKIECWERFSGTQTKD